MDANRWGWALAIVTVLGCGDGDASRAGAGRRSIDSNGGTYTVSFESTPDPIPMNGLFDVRFTVAPKAAGAKTDDLQVQVDARMPAHFHGMNRAPKLTRQADGSFKAEGLLFHMPGHWELSFDVSQGGRTERAQADVELK